MDGILLPSATTLRLIEHVVSLLCFIFKSTMQRLPSLQIVLTTIKCYSLFLLSVWFTFRRDHNGDGRLKCHKNWGTDFWELRCHFTQWHVNHGIHNETRRSNHSWKCRRIVNPASFSIHDGNRWLLARVLCGLSTVEVLLITPLLLAQVSLQSTSSCGKEVLRMVYSGDSVRQQFYAGMSSCAHPVQTKAKAWITPRVPK